MRAMTRGRLSRLGFEHGWQLNQSDAWPKVDEFIKDGDVVVTHYDRGGRLTFAEYRPAGQNWSCAPTHAKLAFVTSWLAGAWTPPEERES